MADVLYQQHAPGRTVYATIWNSAGLVYNGSSFEAYLTSPWTNYDIPLTENGDSGVYSVAFPTLSAGTYAVMMFEQAGGTAAVGDPGIGTTAASWDGSGIVDTSDLKTYGDANWATILAATVGGAVLTNSANKLACNGSGEVTALNMRGTNSANTTTPPTVIENRQEMDSNSTKLSAIVADTNELQSDNVPGLIATAQTDLDTITGSDGVTLATAQANYAPAKAGDEMDLQTDALDAAALKTDAVTEIQNGLGTEAKQDTGIAAIAALNDLSAADIATAVGGTVIDGSQTLQTTLKIVLAILHGKFTKSGTDPIILTYKADDDSTTAATINHDADGSGRTNS